MVESENNDFILSHCEICRSVTRFKGGRCEICRNRLPIKELKANEIEDYLKNAITVIRKEDSDQETG